MIGASLSVLGTTNNYETKSISVNGGWVKHFEGNSWAHVVRQTDDGYVVVGATEPDVEFSTGEGLVMKVDNFGNEIWNTTISNAAFQGLWVTSDNGYIVSGWRTEMPNYMGLMVKLDNNGNVEWEKTYGNQVCAFIQCQQTVDGGFISSGFYKVSESDRAGWLIKTDSDGNELWNKKYGFEDSRETFHSIHQTSDNGFILPGWSSGDGFVVKTDAYGNLMWQQLYVTGISIIGLDKIDNINMGRQAFDGGYIFTGWGSASFLDIGKFWIFKTDENGDVEWEKNYGNLWFHDLGLWIEPTMDGGYLAAGKKNGIGTPLNIIQNGLWMPLRNQLWVIKTNSIGEIEWDFTYEDATARCVQQTTDGGYIIAGHKGPYYGTKGILLIKTDDNGNSFYDKTFALIQETNQPPNTPIIQGPTEISKDEYCWYNISYVDPDGTPIYFRAIAFDEDWGTWWGPIDSGEWEQNWYGNWTEEGDYIVKAKTRDAYGAESDWAELVITVSKSRAINDFNPWLSRLIHRFPILEYLL
jgi:hypothetical protein